MGCGARLCGLGLTHTSLKAQDWGGSKQQTGTGRVDREGKRSTRSIRHRMRKLPATSFSPRVAEPETSVPKGPRGTALSKTSQEMRRQKGRHHI